MKNHILNIDEIEKHSAEIYEVSVRLLAKHGMLIEDDFWRKRILNHQGTSEKNNRIHFSEALIREAIPFGKESGFKLDWTEDSFLFRKNDPEPDGARLRVGGFSLSIFDPELNRIRPSKTSDMEEALMLCDVLGIGGHYPCSATDIHPALRNIMAHKMCLTKSRVNSTHVCTGLEQAEIIYAMHEVIGLEAQMPLTLTVITPFRIEETNLKNIRAFMEKDVDKRSIRIVPVGYGLSGMNYPITIAGSWAMCIAEHMGLYLAALLVESGFKIAPSVGPTGISPIDFRKMSIACGNPNQAFFTFANSVLVHALFGEKRDGVWEPEVPLWTCSPFPDEQAAIEKMSSALMGCQRGAKMYGRLGNLCVDDVFSCEQMLLDIELVNHAREAIQAFSKVDNFMDMENLEKEVEDFVQNDASFMMADSTMKNLRTFSPETGKYFFRGKLASLKVNNLSRALQKASDEKKELLKKYNFKLDNNKEKAIENIYLFAEKKFAK